MVAKQAKTIQSIADLTPDTRNANKGTVRGLAMLEDSLGKYGAGRSILTDKHGNVIAGNKTLERAVDAGMDIEVVQSDGNKLVVVQRTDLDLYADTKARELAYADNRVAQVDLDWSAEALLADVNDGLDLSKFFDDDELAELLSSVTDDPPDDPGAQIDRAEELQAKWQVARGDLYVIPSKSGKGEHRLLCGDSTSAEDVARVMGGEKAALAWFDPPFGIDLQPQRGLTDPIVGDGNIQARQLWTKFLPLLKAFLNENAHVFLCQEWTEFDWTLPLIREYFTLKSKVVWFKNVWGIGYYTRPQHEDVIYCWNGKPDTPSEPVSDVWQIARESSPVHAAEKPAELSSVAITAFTTKRAIVADWFAGVGGSLVACEQTARQGRGIEIEPKYCAVALERLSLMGLSPVKAEA